MKCPAGGVQLSPMAKTSSDEDAGEGLFPEIGEESLREAFLASADPELTMFLDRIGRSDAVPVSPQGSGSWRKFVAGPESEDELGRVEDLTLIEVIAEGHMAVVFLARETALGRHVALKMLSPGLAGNPEARKCFLREAKAAAGLDHACILPLYRVGEKPLPYFTMRLVEDGSLQDRLDHSGRLAPDAWFSVARQAASALGAAHASGIIHRDVKPTNLLMEAVGDRLWVVDFGIAAPPGLPASERRSLLGTPRYMSPEQARGEALDGRSDLFSLGAVLYRCACGEEYVSGGTSAEVLEQLSSGVVPDRLEKAENLLPSQRRLLRRLLAHAPEDRFADADAFLRALEKEKPETRVKRKRLFFGASLACGILLGLGLVGAKFHIPGKSPAPVSGVATLPTIRIDGSEAVYRDLEAALVAAPDGATLLLEGVFVCRKVHFGPVGRRLAIHSAPGGRAVVVASRPDEHALFLRGATELRGIDFLREPAGGTSLPIVGIHGGEAVVSDCRFLTGEAPAVGGRSPRGSALSLTHLQRAVVEDCVFETPGREAMSLAFQAGSPPMHLTVRSCIVLAEDVLIRRIWDGEGTTEIDMEGSVVVAHRLFHEHPRNSLTPDASLAFRIEGSWLDLSGATLHFANGTNPFSENGLPVSWTGRRNRHARSSIKFGWSVPGAPLEIREFDWSVPFPSGISGEETGGRIGALRPAGPQPPTLREILEILKEDDEFSSLATP